MSKRSVRAGEMAELLALMAKLQEKARSRTGKDYPLVVIQEAGLDGFWLHRRLAQENSLESHVVDPGSIAMPRRRRRAKTDRLDGETLLRTLLAYKRGEPRVCAMVRVPSPEELELLLEQLSIVEGERNAMLAAARNEPTAPIAMLDQLRGIGPEFAAVLWSEGFYRRFDNRRQIAAYAGLAPTPWQSGSVERDQGVSKAGNPRLRSTMLQLAWLWLRRQPDSALSRWFHERVIASDSKQRKKVIVALARKLLVALWKYVTSGVAIEGAVLKHA
jgi:transposase